jgi:hypothetical protein
MPKGHIISVHCVFEVNYTPPHFFTYIHNMSSILESLSTEGINIRIYNLPKSINQKNEHQDEELGRIKLKKNDGQLIPRRYFLLCQSCFWCASYIDARSDLDELPYKACPVCDDFRIESLPLSYHEHYDFEYSSNRGVVLKFLRTGIE